VRLPEGDLLLAPTPPPDVDLDAWRASLDAIEAWDPATLAITHFGDYGDVAQHIARMRAALTTWGDLARTTGRDGYADALRAAYDAALGPDGAAAFAQAMPVADQWLGLERYWRRTREAGQTG
jgi:hypothetical protein